MCISSLKKIISEKVPLWLKNGNQRVDTGGAYMGGGGLYVEWHKCQGKGGLICGGARIRGGGGGLIGGEIRYGNLTALCDPECVTYMLVENRKISPTQDWPKMGQNSNIFLPQGSQYKRHRKANFDVVSNSICLPKSVIVSFLEVYVWTMFTQNWIDNRSALKTIPDRPPVHTWHHRSGTIFVTITSWNAPIPKVIRSVSDRFLEPSASNVNSAVQIGPVFGKESRYHSLGPEAGLLLRNQNKYRSGMVWTAQL